MDITELGPRKRAFHVHEHAYAASIFDQPPPPMLSNASPEHSMMDIDPDVGESPQTHFRMLPVERSHLAVPGMLESSSATPSTPGPAPQTSTPPPSAVQSVMLRNDAPTTNSVEVSKPAMPISAFQDDMTEAGDVSFSDLARKYLRLKKLPPGYPQERTSLFARPEALLTYAQVIFNASILLVFLYLLFNLVWTVQRDVSQKVREYDLGMYTY